MFYLGFTRDNIAPWKRRFQQWYGWLQDHKTVFQFIGSFFVIPILIYLLIQIFNNWKLLQECCQYLEISSLLIAFFLVWLAVGLLGYNWLLVLRFLGGDLPFREGLKIYFLTNLGRYLPGFFWHFAGRTVWLAERNISKRVSITSLVLEQSATVVASLVIGMLSWVGAVTFSSSAPLILPILLFFIFGLGIILVSSAQLRQNYSEFLALHNQKRTGLLALMYLCFWIIYGTGVYVLIQAIYISPFSLDQMLQTIGIVAIAWVIGYVSFFAPGGIGIREGILVLLLSTFMPVPIASMVALTSRGLQVAAEILWVILFTIKIDRNTN